MATPLSSHGTASALEQFNRFNGCPELPKNTHPSDNYSYNNSTPPSVCYSDPSDITGSSGTSASNYNYGARKFNRAQILGIVKNDPVFQMATTNWGTFAPTLIKACNLLGVKPTRDCILRVRAIAEWRFSDEQWDNRKEPFGCRRGRYLVQCLKHEAEARNLTWRKEHVVTPS